MRMLTKKRMYFTVVRPQPMMQVMVTAGEGTRSETPVSPLSLLSLQGNDLVTTIVLCCYCVHRVHLWMTHLVISCSQQHEDGKKGRGGDEREGKDNKQNAC
jgi:hypothetical protein